MQLLHCTRGIGQRAVGSLISGMQLLGGFVQVGLCSGQLSLEFVLDGRQIVVDRLQVVNTGMRLLQVGLGLLARTDGVVKRSLALLQLRRQRRHLSLGKCVLNWLVNSKPR